MFIQITGIHCIKTGDQKVSHHSIDGIPEKMKNVMMFIKKVVQMNNKV